MSDAYWLGKYLEDGSEAAFRSLVQRHLDLVYATAYRRVGNQALAEEATQNVFILLARKAASLRHRADLAGWLYRAALLKAKEIAREESRRAQRESQAAVLGTAMKEGDSLLKSLAAVLDEAMLDLREKDRQALLLRFFEDKSLREVGAALGVGEDAAQKRVAAALQSLTRAFRKRGYPAAGAAAAVAALRGAVQAAPSGLLAVVSQTAVAQAAGASLAGVSTLLARLMSLTKTQTAAVCLLLSVGPIALEWHALSAVHAEREFWRRQITTARAELPALEAKQKQTKRRLDAARAAAAQLQQALDRRHALAAAGTDEALYRWSEDSDYVRVPKSLLGKIALAGLSARREEQGSDADPTRPVIEEDGTVSSVLVEAFGLATNQVAALQDSLACFSRDFEALAREHSVFTNTPPGTHGLGGDSKTLLTSPFPEQGALLEQRLRQSLESILGPERAEILWRQARNDFVYRFNDFGRAEKMTTVVRADTLEPWFFVIGAVRQNGEVSDYRSAGFNLEEPRPDLRAWWPDLRPDTNNSIPEQQ